MALLDTRCYFMPTYVVHHVLDGTDRHRLERVTCFVDAAVKPAKRFSRKTELTTEIGLGDWLVETEYSWRSSGGEKSSRCVFRIQQHSQSSREGSTAVTGL